MNIGEFLDKAGFTSYGSVVNSWDSFNLAGSVLMQLWQAPGQRVHSHSVLGAYLRVCCFDAAHYTSKGKNHLVGYAGRLRAIKTVEDGEKGFAALSAPPEGKRGAGIWAKYADLTKVYPILAIERPADSQDVFAVLGRPVSVNSME